MSPSSAAPSPAHDCAQAVLAQVPALMREIRRAMRAAAPPGLSVPQFRALIFAQREPGSGVGALAAHLGVTLPTASALVAALVGRGLLRLKPHAQDRRRRLIDLTPAGRRIVDKAWRETADGFTARLEGLSKAELSTAGQALERLARQLNALS